MNAKQYLARLKEIINRGNYTELTFRPALEEYLKSLDPEIDINWEPSRIKNVGAPDAAVYKNGNIIGYIETKLPEKNLDVVMLSDQIRKYMNAFDNLILTNFFQFIVISKGEVVNRVHFIPGKSNRQNEKTLSELFKTFSHNPTQHITNPESLAQALANGAHTLRDAVLDAFNKKSNPSLEEFHKLLNQIEESDYNKTADIYAQLFTYGAFLARLSSKQTITKELIASKIPIQMGLIRALIGRLSLNSHTPSIEYAMDVIVNTVNAANPDSLFYHGDSSDMDPFLHFYETFLQYYNPSARKELGQYYTPLPVARFMVRIVDQIIREKFGKKLGLADKGVEVLDPATGTGTFLLAALEKALETTIEVHPNSYSQYIQDNTLKNFYGFEISATPYIIAHAKLTDFLVRNGIETKDRLGVYLTNTLDLTEPKRDLFFQEVNDEVLGAYEIKSSKTLLAIIGNPPYNARSKNNTPDIKRLMNDYYQLDGVPIYQLGFKHTAVLNDDYVKFIRFAQHKIEEHGEGIVAYITNHNYLDGGSFAGMRKSLFSSFNYIYIINLHGDKNRGETDEGIFNIRVGTAISIMVKLENCNEHKVFYIDLKGKRQEKFQHLQSLNLDQFQEIQPEPDEYQFVPYDSTNSLKYRTFPSMDKIFSLMQTGIVTGDDQRFISFDNSFQMRNINEDLIHPIMFRPFDIRSIYYDTEQISNSRTKITNHLIKTDNMLLAFSHQTRVANLDSIIPALITNSLVDKHLLVDSTAAAPLYLISKDGDKIIRTPNFTDDFKRFFKEKYGIDATSEGIPKRILAYIYAILYSPSYLRKYIEFMKYNYPHIPFLDKERFDKLADLGSKLINLHLMKEQATFTVDPDSNGELDATIGKVKFHDGRLYINDTTYLRVIHADPITEEDLNFKIGTRKVLLNWLKSRKGRTLTPKDYDTIAQILYVIRETRRIMKDIDEVLTENNELVI